MSYDPDYNKMVFDVLTVLNDIDERIEQIEEGEEFDAELYEELDLVYHKLLQALEFNGIVVE